MKSKVRIVSFANTGLTVPVVRFAHQVRRLDSGAELFVYNERNVPYEYSSRFSSVFNKDNRGFGFYTWKPAIILDCLENMPLGDVLVYSDIGNHINPGGVHMYRRIVEVLNDLEMPIVANQIASSQYNEKHYTKGDVLDLLGVRYNESLLSTGQFQSGMIFIRKTSETLRFIESWNNVALTDVRYFDDTPSMSPSYSEFVEHRHDQSSFSILAKLNGLYSIPEYLFYVHDYRVRNRIRFSPVLNLRDLGGVVPYDMKSNCKFICNECKRVIKSKVVKLFN